MIKVSIIIPCYNSELYIEQCLKSILKQADNNIEIICIDDGSTDNTAEVVKQYIGKNVKLLKYQHQGISKSKKIGCEVSQGQYLYFMDSDDWLEDGAIRKIIDCLEKNDVDAVFWGYNIHRGKAITQCRNILGSGSYKRMEFLPRLYDIENSRNTFNWAQWSYVVKRQIVEPIIEGVFDEIKKYEDVQATWSCLLEMKNICVLDEMLYHYRYSDNSAGHSPYQYSLADLNRVYVDLEEKNSKVDGYESVLNRQLRYLFFDLMQGAVSFSGERQDFFMFPYEKVRGGAKIIIYGAGMVGKSYFRQIRHNHYCNLIAWCDKNNGMEYKGFMISSFDSVMNEECDYYVIANLHYEEAVRIKAHLVSQYNIDENKIVVNIPQKLSCFVDLDIKEA